MEEVSSSHSPAALKSPLCPSPLHGTESNGSTLDKSIWHSSLRSFNPMVQRVAWNLHVKCRQHLGLSTANGGASGLGQDPHSCHTGVG